MIYYKTESPKIQIPGYTIVCDSREEFDNYMNQIYDENGSVKLPEGFTDEDYFIFLKQIFNIVE